MGLDRVLKITPFSESHKELKSIFHDTDTVRFRYAGGICVLDDKKKDENGIVTDITYIDEYTDIDLGYMTFRRVTVTRGGDRHFNKVNECLSRVYRIEAKCSAREEKRKNKLVKASKPSDCKACNQTGRGRRPAHTCSGLMAVDLKMQDKEFLDWKKSIDAKLYLQWQKGKNAVIVD